MSKIIGFINSPISVRCTQIQDTYYITATLCGDVFDSWSTENADNVDMLMSDMADAVRPFVDKLHEYIAAQNAALKTQRDALSTACDRQAEKIKEQRDTIALLSAEIKNLRAWHEVQRAEISHIDS